MYSKNASSGDWHILKKKKKKRFVVITQYFNFYMSIYNTNTDITVI